MRLAFTVASMIASVATLAVASSSFAQSQNPAVQPAKAAADGGTLARIKAKGFVRCGGAPRPGLAAETGDRWSGLEVEICRALAVAVLGETARFAYHRYASEKDYDAPRAGADDVSFVTFSEMAEHKLAGSLLPGPTVFVETHHLMVAADAKVGSPADLGGKGICFVIARAADNSQEAFFAEHGMDVVPFGFQEDGEMYDAYDVQRCQAVAGEATELAEARRDGGVNHLKSRLLPEPLAAFPIVAATPLREDARWAAVVRWTVDTLINADAIETPHRPSGLKAMAIDGPALGLDPGWQKRVVDTVGSYGAIFERTLGAGSPLKLPRGLNTAGGGGVLMPMRRD